MDRSNPVPIAIIGYGYRLPGGINNDDEFWKLISERGFVQEPIEDRYGKGQCPHDGFDSPMRVASPYEGLIKDGEELHFDCALFGMSPNDAKRMDPQCKMMLSCTWEALEMAGLDQASLHNSNTGVFCGVQVSSCAGWRPPYGATPSDVPGKSLSMISNRISFHFNWMGPSFSVATACSSGITALDAAVKSLSLGECDLAASGAVNYLGHEVGSIGFNQLGIISKTGTSRSFDKDANGYMRAEGAFMYLLKRLPDAERDGDRIFAVIRGCGLNTAGAEKDADVLTQGRMIVAPVPQTTPPSRAARARAPSPPRATALVLALPHRPRHAGSGHGPFGQARCTRDAPEMHPKCTQNAPEMHPRCTAPTRAILFEATLPSPPLVSPGARPHLP